MVIIFVLGEDGIADKETKNSGLENPKEFLEKNLPYESQR